MSTHTWKIVTTEERLDRWFPLHSCEHVNFCKIDDDQGVHFIFHRGARWYYLNTLPSGKLILRRAWLHEYCSWYTSIEENRYDPAEKYFANSILD
ncbi:MAG TPA: hypothetical protein PK297_13860 [Spirochaetota bacterium]|nr:hypothetical protein [Spirochaetota bacterium]